MIKKKFKRIFSKSSESSPTEKEAPKANHRNRKHRAEHLISETERQAAGKVSQSASHKLLLRVVKTDNAGL
jgi:hypothetical protein